MLKARGAEFSPDGFLAIPGSDRDRVASKTEIASIYAVAAPRKPGRFREPFKLPLSRTTVKMMILFDLT